MQDGLKSFIGRAKRAEQDATGIMPAFFGFFQGRTTFFSIIYGVIGAVFAVVAVWCVLHGRDVSGLSSVILAFATFLGALQAMLVTHSAKEDWIELQHRKLDIEEQKLGSQQNG